jgi:hypothetical protein
MAKSRRALAKSSAGMSKRDFKSARALVSVPLVALVAAGAASGDKKSAKEKVNTTA